MMAALAAPDISGAIDDYCRETDFILLCYRDRTLASELLKVCDNNESIARKVIRLCDGNTYTALEVMSKESAAESLTTLRKYVNSRIADAKLMLITLEVRKVRAR